MNPDLIEILRAAQRARRDGVASADIDHAIVELTAGEFATFADLSGFVSSQQRGGGRAGGPGGESVPSPQAAAAVEIESRGPIQLRDLGRMAVQGATLGFGDELAGVLGGDTEASRQRLAAIRGAHPIAATIAEGLGAAAVPVGGLSRAGFTVGRGIATGALTGGLLGAGGGTGTAVQRAPGAVAGAVGGGVAGGLLGFGVPAAERVVSRVVARAQGAPVPRTAAQLAERFGERAGIGRTGEIGSLVDDAKAAIRQVRQTAFRPLEARFAVVDDPIIADFLNDPRMVPHVRGIVPRGENASFTQLQGVLNRLRGKRKAAATQGRSDLVQRFDELAGELDTRMRSQLEGFAEAQTQFRLASQASEAFDKGAKALNRTPESLARTMRDLDPAARNNFRLGLASTMFDRLSQRGGVITKEQVERLQSLGWQGRLRQMFETDVQFSRFNKDLERAGMATLPKDGMTRMRRALWAALGIGAGGGFTARALLDN